MWSRTRHDIEARRHPTLRGGPSGRRRGSSAWSARCVRRRCCPVHCDGAGDVGVLAQPPSGVRAPGHHRETVLDRARDGGRDQLPRDSLTPEGVVDLGVQQEHAVAVDFVRQLAQGAVVREHEPLVRTIVADGRHWTGPPAAGTGRSSGRSAQLGIGGGSGMRPTSTAGKPSRSVPSANCERCLTTAPARTTQPAPTTLVSQTIAPGSMTDPAPMRHPWIIAPGPTITPSWMMRSLSGSRCKTVFSSICTWLPMRTGPCESPMIFTPAPMMVRSPTTTSPVISAVGNNVADVAMVGRMSRYAYSWPIG